MSGPCHAHSKQQEIFIILQKIKKDRYRPKNRIKLFKLKDFPSEEL